VETTVTNITVLEGRREGREESREWRVGRGIGDRIRDWVMSEIVHRREGKGREKRDGKKRKEEKGAGSY
jgi:hypothetical protein